MMDRSDKAGLRELIEFEGLVGLIDSIDNLSEVGAPDGYDANGVYSVSALEDLLLFVKRNPSFHIATLTSDSDDVQIDDEHIAITIDNNIRYTNRVGYYLCQGDKDERLNICAIVPH